jgi:hypothetical protein
MSTNEGTNEGDDLRDAISRLLAARKSRWVSPSEINSALTEAGIASSRFKVYRQLAYLEAIGRVERKGATRCAKWRQKPKRAQGAGMTRSAFKKALREKPKTPAPVPFLSELVRVVTGDKNWTVPTLPPTVEEAFRRIRIEMPDHEEDVQCIRTLYSETEGATPEVFFEKTFALIRAKPDIADVVKRIRELSEEVWNEEDGS